jgi:hypothetical protein
VSTSRTAAGAAAPARSIELPRAAALRAAARPWLGTDDFRLPERSRYENDQPEPGRPREEQLMATTVTQYQVKPERAEENQRLIEAVFAELDRSEPEGFTVKVFRLEDGVRFVHVVIEHDDVDHPDSLQAMPVFQAFVANIGDRCDVPPAISGATVVGGFR